MSKWKLLFLVALLALAFGLESVAIPEQGRVAVQLTVLGAVLAFFVVCCLWWRMLAKIARTVLLLLAVFTVALLANRWGIWEAL